MKALADDGVAFVLAQVSKLGADGGEPYLLHRIEQIMLAKPWRVVRRAIHISSYVPASGVAAICLAAQRRSVPCAYSLHIDRGKELLAADGRVLSLYGVQGQPFG
jgi:hypothetical protein